MHPSRRDFLGATAGAVGLVACGGGGKGRRRVGIVGGGMAGVATAWLLEGAYDVVLFEAKDALGGNARTVDVDVDGRVIPVDLGAQFFHPGPYPTYVRLLDRLGLTGAIHELESTITILAAGEDVPRFVSPTSERGWAVTEEWNQQGLAAFLALAQRGRALAEGDADVTVDEWLATLDLDETQRDAILLPWIASLYSGDVEQARGFSARSALTFLTRALGADPLAPITYRTLAPGMGAAIDALAAQAPSAAVHLSSPVDAVSRDGDGFRIAAAAVSERVDVLVVAAPAHVAAPLLAEVAGAEALRAALAAIEWHDAALALHREPLYAPAEPAQWSFFNARVEGGFCEGSMWLAPAVAPVDGAPVDLWKSWVTHRADPPASPLATAEFRHMLPTPATLAAQRALAEVQGQGGIHVVGGTTREYDSQETALASAMDVAAALDPDGARLASLREE